MSKKKRIKELERIVAMLESEVDTLKEQRISALERKIVFLEKMHAEKKEEQGILGQKCSQVIKDEMNDATFLGIPLDGLPTIHDIRAALEAERDQRFTSALEVLEAKSWDGS